jgi:hypothetical protein
MYQRIILDITHPVVATTGSVGMRKQGMTKSRVFAIWTSLMLFTGIGAAPGGEFFIGAAYALV